MRSICFGLSILATFNVISIRCACHNYGCYWMSGMFHMYRYIHIWLAWEQTCLPLVCFSTLGIGALHYISPVIVIDRYSMLLSWQHEESNQLQSVSYLVRSGNNWNQFWSLELRVLIMIVFSSVWLDTCGSAHLLWLYRASRLEVQDSHHELISQSVTAYSLSWANQPFSYPVDVENRLGGEWCQ